MKTTRETTSPARKWNHALGAIMLLGMLLAIAPTNDAHAAHRRGRRAHRAHRAHRHHNHHRHNRGFVGIGFSSQTQRHWVSGHYTYRTEEVLVAPERFEKVWVAPKYKEIVSGSETIRVKVRDGYFKEVYVPARYATQTVKV